MEPRVETRGEPIVEPTGQPLWQAPVAQDDEIPSLGRVGSTALGFVSAPDPGPASLDTVDVESPSDDLRLFD